MGHWLWGLTSPEPTCDVAFWSRRFNGQTNEPTVQVLQPKYRESLREQLQATVLDDRATIHHHRDASRTRSRSGLLIDHA